MKRTPRPPSLTPDEQAVLDYVEVRVLLPEERPCFDALLVTEHYLHSAELVGEQLRYVAEVGGQWVALLAWSAPAFRLKGPRSLDRFVARPETAATSLARQQQSLPRPT